MFREPYAPDQRALCAAAARRRLLALDAADACVNEGTGRQSPLGLEPKSQGLAR
jgi:hypothetical protein